MKTSIETVTLSQHAKNLNSLADECDRMALECKLRRRQLLAKRETKRPVKAGPSVHIELKPRPTMQSSPHVNFLTRVIHARNLRGLGAGTSDTLLPEIISEEKRIRQLSIEAEGTGSVAGAAARQLARTEDLTQARLTDLGLRGGQRSRRRANKAIVAVQMKSEFSEELWNDRAEHARVSRPRLRP